MKLNKIIILVLVISLSISVLMNIILWQRLIACYLNLQIVRLDPTSSRKFTAENLYFQETDTGKARIILLGDSRITQWNPLPSLPNCQLLNRGVSSETTAQTILRLDRDIIKLQPSIVVVQTGINDLKCIGIFPKRKEEIIDSCCKNLNRMINQMVEHKIHVVILTIFPPGPVELCRRPVWSNEIHYGIDKINKVIRNSRGQRVTVVDCDPILAINKSVKEEYAQDALHLSPAGYIALNKSLIPILEKLVEKYPGL